MFVISYCHMIYVPTSGDVLNMPQFKIHQMVQNHVFHKSICDIWFFGLVVVSYGGSFFMELCNCINEIYIMWKSWRCYLICSSEFILERIVFYNVSYYYTLKFKASFLLKRQICHSSLHMCRCFEALSVNCLTIVFVLTLRYVFAVFLLNQN